MIPVAQPIAIAEIPGAFLITLPPRLWLVLSLRKSFRGVQAAAAPWTYRVAALRGTARRIEAWLAEIELQVRAEARRRAWSATDDEWSGAAASSPGPARPMDSAPIAVALPRKRTAKEVLQLLDRLAAGAVLVVAVKDGARAYRLTPSGRKVRTAVAERAIRDRFVRPGLDGLLGPETSQTWHAPTAEDLHAATQRSRTRRAPDDGQRKAGPAGSPARPGPRRPARADRKGQAGPVEADDRGRAVSRRRRGVS